MRILVVDDEPLARRRLLRLLAKIPGVEVAGEASDGIEAKARIDELRPDLVLLDIHMPGKDGLALAESPDFPPFIFTTAHDAHAIRAFELQAIDYLLKPIEVERLERAIERARGTRWSRGAMTSALGDGGVRLSARSGGTVYLFEAAEISRLHAADKYTVFYAGGREHLLDESLNQLEARLAPSGFLRVHRAELVNLGKVRALHVGDGLAEVELEDGQRAPVSRRSLGEVRRRLGLDG